MAFITDQLAKLNNKPDYTVVNFGGRLVFVESVKRIREITPTLIVISVKNAIVEIAGEGLEIEEIDGGSVTVKGVISVVEQKE